MQKVLYKNPNRWQLDLIPVIRVRKKTWFQRKVIIARWFLVISSG